MQINKVFISRRNVNVLEISKVIKMKRGLHYLFYEGKPEPIQSGLKAQLFPEAFCYQLCPEDLTCSLLSYAFELLAFVLYMSQDRSSLEQQPCLSRVCKVVGILTVHYK